MRNYSAIADFAKTLAGTFDNINQAQENPKDFARIKIFFDHYHGASLEDQVFILSNAMTMLRGIPTGKGYIG